MVMAKRMPAISRRTFLARSAGASLVMGLGAVLPGCSRDEVVADVASSGASTLFSPSVWFEISDQGAVLINIMRAEMGQHVGTALARIIADELGADWDSVSIKHVDTDPKWGYMVTGGSWSVHTSFTQLSQAGAAGRTVLVDAGAALLGVDAAQCTAVGGVVRAGSESISFADIISKGDVSRVFSDEEIAAMPVKVPADRDLIGKATKALDIPAKSKGEATYGIDVEMPDMVFAHPVLPPTRYKSVVKGVDDEAAQSIPGYLQTLTINNITGFTDGWVLVIAETFPAAMKAAAQVKVEWEGGETAEVSEADLFAAGQSLADDASSGVLVVDDGDAPAARAAAAETLSATYRTGTLLHFTLEPQNALVHYENGAFHIHSGNQWQSLILPYLATALGVDESKIEIHQYYLGGGYGRRLIGDQMVPAALAARELGRPVKLLMQRAHDSQFDCVRSPSVCRFDASYDADGELTGVEHAAAAGWPTKTMAPGFLAPAVAGDGKYDTFSISGADHWYDLPAHRVRAINNPLAQETFLPGWWRAVGPGWTGWGVECFMDELAEKAGEDPVAFRLARLTGAGKNAGSAPNAVGGATRLAAALKDVAERAGWGRELPPGEALGVAVAHGQERNMPTWTACIAHVAVDAESNAISVKKIWQSIDCGTVVHPDGAMAQAEGATLWGLSVALHEGTQFANGHVADTNLDTYSPLRMADVPELDLKLMPSDAFPSGLGEPPLIAVAPAIGNAVYRATGKRARDLPIRI